MVITGTRALRNACVGITLRWEMPRASAAST